MPTLQDHQIRIQQIICCIGDMGCQLSDKLKIGYSCECDIINLEVLLGMLDALYCYDPTATDNCLTQLQVDKMFQYISKICGVCYFPYGTNYAQLAARQGILLQLNGSRLLQLNNGLININ